MPRKPALEKEEISNVQGTTDISESEVINQLSSMLASVLNYLSDDDIEEIDLDYLLNHTEGLQEWWDQYRERNRKHLEEEIKEALEDLSLEDLEKIRDQIKVKNE